MNPSERREQILEHAAALFGQKGYHSTSIADIIRSAGIARGTFYLYFENKRAIFEELLDYLVIQIKKRIKIVDTSEGAPSAREQLLGNITRVIEMLADNRALLSILLEGAVGLDKGFADKLSFFYEQLAQTIELSLNLGQKMGLVRPCDTRISALTAIGALKEVLHHMLRSEDGRVNIRELAAEILDIFSRGVLIDGVSIP
ncbi:MAG: TetR/AcrR family transcriptional regulator [Proteobacteria bacterium]|nr:TetR/AcrR family transcriptional regulator [Pseudomonadota bacterium]